MFPPWPNLETLFLTYGCPPLLFHIWLLYMFLSSIFYHDDFSPHEKYTPQEQRPGSAEFCVPSTWYRPWHRAEAEYVFVQGLYLPCLYMDTKEGGGTAVPSDCKVLLGIWPFTLVHISSPGCLS